MYKAEMRTASGTVYTAYADTPYEALCALMEDGHEWRYVRIRPTKPSERERRREAQHAHH